MTVCISSLKSTDDSWKAFIDTGKVGSKAVRRVIYQSWRRCMQDSVDPYDTGVHENLQGKKLQRAMHERERLIGVARPFMADLYEIVKGTGFVVALTNENGYILELFSDEGAAETPMTRNFLSAPAGMKRMPEPTPLAQHWKSVSRFRFPAPNITAKSITVLPARLHRYLIRRTS